MRPGTVAANAVRVVVAVLAVVSLAGCFRTTAPRSTPPPPEPDHRELFVVSVAPWAQESEKRTGVPASVTIGQAILESGWGDSALSMYAANYFGIKCSTTHTSVRTGCVTMSTTEYDSSGRASTEAARFRTYTTVVDSFIDHGLLLKSLSRYAKAFRHTDDPKKFVKELQAGGYATDPQYARLVSDLIDQYDLTRFDSGSPSVESGSPSVERSRDADEPAVVRGWVPDDYRDAYATAGGSRGDLGYPVGGRRILGDGSAEGLVFDAGLMINSDHGVFALDGAVWQVYRTRQSDRARLGWPTGSVETLAGSPAMRFDSGIIIARSKNPIVVAGPIGARWIAEGGDTGRLGLPTKPVATKKKSETAVFAGGTITRDTTSGKVTVAYS